jgi:hypothetical protein
MSQWDFWPKKRVVVRPQDYSGFGLKPQKQTPKWAQLALRAPAPAAGGPAHTRGQRHRNQTLR